MAAASGLCFKNLKKLKLGLWLRGRLEIIIHLKIIGKTDKVTL